MKQRIPGLDLAKAYAIFGMYIVNFTFCFGSFKSDPLLGWFSSLFIGNSTSIFIICAGMGIVFLSANAQGNPEQEKKVRSIVVRRSWFLFAIGLLLYNWWPGDILHFYGGYMHIAAFLLFIPRRNYLSIATLAIIIYTVLQFFIPITFGWNLQTTQYADFWTPNGFLRNTFYNGWNSIFPWFAYFAIGMYLGRLDWNRKQVRRNVFITGVCLLAVFKGLRMFIRYDWDSPRNWFYTKYCIQLMEDYFPVNIPYLMITIGFAFVVISLCVVIGDMYSQSTLVHIVASTGQMTLTHYVSHMTIGVVVLSLLTHKPYTGYLSQGVPAPQAVILMYAILFFLLSIAFSYIWRKRFAKGPLEILMRKNWFASNNNITKQE